MEIDFDAFTVENSYAPGQPDRIVEEVDAIVLRGSLCPAPSYLDDVRLVTRIPAADPEPATAVSENLCRRQAGGVRAGSELPEPLQRRDRPGLRSAGRRRHPAVRVQPRRSEGCDRPGCANLRVP